MRSSFAMSWLARLTRPHCPPGWKLTRAISGAVDSRTEWHVIGCARCSAEYRALEALIKDARAAVPVAETLSRETRNEIGTRLRALASAPRLPRADRRALIALLLAVPAIAAMVLWTGRRADHGTMSRVAPQGPTAVSEDSRATIRAIGPARFSRAQFQPDEIVRLDDGEIELEIAPLHANERFRVVTDDGEVEVRGTYFKVLVIDHHLAGVHVWKGQVEVRSSGGAQAILAPGDDWVRAAQPALPAETPQAAAPLVRLHAKANAKLKTVPAMAPAPGPLPATRDRRPIVGQPSFGHAWSLLRSGDAKAAAAELAEVERLARGRDIEEDALYWRAVAVERTGDDAGARTLFGTFLERFPSSSRAGEAAAALGRLLLDAGDPRGARQAFERAARDPSPRVRADARDGLLRTQQSDR